MYNYKRITQTSILINKSYIGEKIEDKVRRMIVNKEPIEMNTQMIFTEKKDGVLPNYDIRTDRFDVAIQAHDYITKAKIAKSEEKTLAQQAKEGMEKENVVGDQSTAGTTNSPGGNEPKG